MDIDQKFIDYIEAETKDQIKYMYDKVYRFFAIDLSIFPLVIAIFSISLPSLNFFSIIISLIAFSIGVLLKLYIITFKLHRYLTPPSLFDVNEDDDFLSEDKKKEELLNHRVDKIRNMWKDIFRNDRFMRLVNQSIWFSACALICIMTNLIQVQLIAIGVNLDLVLWIIFTINIIAFGLACLYKLLRKHKQKLKFWKKKS